MDFIKRYWERQGEAHGTAPSASWADKGCIALEIDTLVDSLPQRANLLDVGCANGHATFPVAARTEARRVTGVDYSEAMIEGARRRLGEEKPAAAMHFEVADARRLPFADHEFDAVYCTRMLINLPNWEEQTRALREMLRVCRPGGRVVVLEAFTEPLARLNAARLAAGLAPLVEHDFNRYLKERALADFLDGEGLRFRIRPFAGIYYIGTRLLRELLVDTEISGYDSPFHDAFRALDARYDACAFSVQQAVIIERP